MNAIRVSAIGVLPAEVPVLESLARMFRGLSFATAIGGGVLLCAALAQQSAASDGYGLRVWEEELHLSGLMLLCLAIVLLIVSIDFWSRARHARLMERLSQSAPPKPPQSR